MSTEFKVEKIDAGLFGGGGVANTVGTVLDSVLRIRFSQDEISAIITVISIALRAAGLQGLQDIVAMLIQWEQAYVNGLKAGNTTPTASK